MFFLAAATVAIVPLGDAARCLQPHAFAGIAENVLIDVFDPNTLMRRRVGNRNVDEIQSGSLILADELSTPQ